MVRSKRQNQVVKVTVRLPVANLRILNRVWLVPVVLIQTKVQRVRQVSVNC